MDLYLPIPLLSNDTAYYYFYTNLIRKWVLWKTRNARVSSRVPISSGHDDFLAIPVMMIDTYLYSEELPADEVLRLRVFLLRRARPRQVTSPASQVEQQYGTASTLTSSPASISHSRAASWRKGAQKALSPTLIHVRSVISWQMFESVSKLRLERGCLKDAWLKRSWKNAVTKTHTFTIGRHGFNNETNRF